MAKIVEKNVRTLKTISRSKKIKLAIKQTVIGVVLTSIALSTVPTLKYNVALFNAKNDSYISNVLNNGDTKTEQVKTIYAKAINSNPNLDEELKKKMIESFSEYVLDKYAGFFTEENIQNMYAVASTETIHEMSDFAKEHGWWSGDYKSYFNNITSWTLDDSRILAHEQLHAIVKSGLFGTGLTNGINGYGANEGVTSIMADENNYNYYGLRNVMDQMGLSLGYKNVIKYYLNGDLTGLKKEIYQYLPKEDSDNLVGNLDKYVFSKYLLCFLQKNNLPEEWKSSIQSEINKLVDEITAQLEIICRAKSETDLDQRYLYNNVYGERNDIIYSLNHTNLLNSDATYEFLGFDDKNIYIRFIQGKWLNEPYTQELSISHDEFGKTDLYELLHEFEQKNMEALDEGVRQGYSL